MKKTITLIILLHCISYLVNAQSTDPIIKFLVRNGYTFPDSIAISVIPDSAKKWPDSVFYNTTYKPHLMRTPTIPYSFTKYEYANGISQVTPILSLGYGYTWFKGSMVFDEDGNTVISPGLYWGAAINAGVQSNFSISKLSLNPADIYNSLGSFFVGGFIGFSSLSVFVGYDFISHGPSIDLGGRIDLYTLNNKYLKLLGKIRSVRRHKKFVPQIKPND